MYCSNAEFGGLEPAAFNLDPPAFYYPIYEVQEEQDGANFGYRPYLHVQYNDQQTVKYFHYSAPDTQGGYQDLWNTGNSISVTSTSTTEEAQMPEFLWYSQPEVPDRSFLEPLPLEEQPRDAVLCYWPQDVEVEPTQTTSTPKSLSSESGSGPSTDAESPRISSINGRLQCTFCPSTFSRSYSLKRHIQRIHEKGANFCPKCSKHYGHLNDLQKHIKTCIRGVVYQCPSLSCGKAMKSVEAFRRHLSQHEREVCNFYESHLSEPLISCVHSQEALCNRIPSVLSFCCPICQKSFLKKVLFERHLLIHLSC